MSVLDWTRFASTRMNFDHSQFVQISDKCVLPLLGEVLKEGNEIFCSNIGISSYRTLNTTKFEMVSISSREDWRFTTVIRVFKSAERISRTENRSFFGMSKMVGKPTTAARFFMIT